MVPLKASRDKELEINHKMTQILASQTENEESRTEEKKRRYLSIQRANERKRQNNLIQNGYKYKSPNYLFLFHNQQRHYRRHKQRTDHNTINDDINTNNNNRNNHNDAKSVRNIPALLHLQRQGVNSSNISNQTASDITSTTKSDVFSYGAALSSSMKNFRVNHAKSMCVFETDDVSPTTSPEQVNFSSFTRNCQTTDSEYFREYYGFPNKMCNLYSNRYSDKKTMRKKTNAQSSDNDISDDESSIITLKTDFVLNVFGDLTPAYAISCLRDMLQYDNIDANLQLAVEEFESLSGFYLFLGAKVNTTQDINVIFKYIHEVRQYAQVELMCRENMYYDPDDVKTFLIESNKIKDSRTLIHVCDRHEFVDELTNHLYTNQLCKSIEVYVARMNPHATPKVVGSLLDPNAPEHQIQNLMNSVTPQCPVDEFVGEVEKRVRITLLLPWLEA